MSADNWVICPKCKKIVEQEHQDLSEEVKNSYGKVSQEEYLKLIAEREQSIKLENSLREDYETGVDEGGQFYIYYRCSCEVCHFNFSYKHDEQLNLE